MSCLYILEINPLLFTSFTNIFSCSVGCLFILFIYLFIYYYYYFFFAVQKLLSLIGSHLFIWKQIQINRSKKILLLFMSKSVLPRKQNTLGNRSKKILLLFMSKSVLPMFFSSSLTFSSLIHFEFIFVYAVKRECSNFILSHRADQFSQHYSLKRVSFLYCIFLPLLLD